MRTIRSRVEKRTASRSEWRLLCRYDRIEARVRMYRVARASLLFQMMGALMASWLRTVVRASRAFRHAA